MKGWHEFVFVAKPINENFVWVSIRIVAVFSTNTQHHASYIHPQRQRFHWIVSR